MEASSDPVGLYTPLSHALAELNRRRSDLPLRKKIEEYFASHPCPPELQGEARVVMAPPLVTPNLELKYFVDACAHLPIRTLFYEYRKDKFVHLNFEKRYLGELVFFLESSGIREVTGSTRVVDFEKDQGKPMEAITTLQGENFVDFHHRLTSAALPGADIEIHDFSAWFEQSRLFSLEHPYLRYLGLFLCEGVLCGNFVRETHHARFTHTMVAPAYRKLQEVFGVAPLIVPIAPVETDEESFWCYYPEEVRHLM